MEKYYKINYDLINNYKKENINYQILENINEIKNNIKLKDIDEIINNNDINNKFKNILYLSEKFRNKKIKSIDENKYSNNTNNFIPLSSLPKKDVKLIGKKRSFDYSEYINMNEIINEDIRNNIITEIDENFGKTELNKNNESNNEIKIRYEKIGNYIKKFGKEFVEKNKAKCKILFENKLKKLTEFIELSDLSKNEDTIEIKLIGIDRVINMNYIYECKSLLSLENNFNWNNINVINTSYMFSGCSSLISLNIFNLNISKTIDMSYMFSDCSSLKSLLIFQIGIHLLSLT